MSIYCGREVFLAAVFLKVGDFVEQISSRHNPFIVHMKKLAVDRAYRRETGEFICQGRKLLEEAARYGEITAIIFSGEKPEGVFQNIRLVNAPESVIASVSTMQSVPDVVFSCRIPHNNGVPKIGGKYLLLETVQDPGNLGTVLRTADAFGIDGIVLCGSSADPYGPKAVRASMGAVFRKKVYELSYEMLPELNMPIYGTALTHDSEDIRNVNLDGAIVALGSEGQGLSEKMLGLCSRKLIIPMQSYTESLNLAAAAAVVIWELCGRKANV